MHNAPYRWGKGGTRFAVLTFSHSNPRHLTGYVTGIMHCVVLYTVSQKKTSKIIFVITMSNFHQIWQFLAQRWQIV